MNEIEVKRNCPKCGKPVTWTEPVGFNGKGRVPDPPDLMRIESNMKFHGW